MQSCRECQSQVEGWESTNLKIQIQASDSLDVKSVVKVIDIFKVKRKSRSCPIKDATNVENNVEVNLRI